MNWISLAFLASWRLISGSLGVLASWRLISGSLGVLAAWRLISAFQHVGNEPGMHPPRAERLRAQHRQHRRDVVLDPLDLESRQRLDQVVHRPLPRFRANDHFG